jgi:hypothetical protein
MREAAVQARLVRLLVSTALAMGLGIGLIRLAGPVLSADSPKTDFNDEIARHAKEMLEEGKQTFRFDTFGDEAFWSDKLLLHEAIAGKAHGGRGEGLSPKTALELGLKVDAEALPQDLVDKIKAGEVDLQDPATTLALLKLNAVVGVKGPVGDKNTLKSVGITCALCHSTVDDSFSPGIGKRLDGWPNRDLNVGKIISLAPDLSAVTALLDIERDKLEQVLGSWGPGKFDAEVILDGKGMRPDGKSAATLIPPAYGLAGVNLHTYTGWGSVTYWNAFVANLEMHGQGTFFDPRLDDKEQFPVAAKAKLGHRQPEDDLITSKLAALHFYQLAMPAPKPEDGSFDAEAAQRGEKVFNGPGRCATCHVPPLFTEPGWSMHTAKEIGIDDFQAGRSPDRRYRTTPLRALLAHAKGGFYHDGRFKDLDDVVDHYQAVFGLKLSDEQQKDLVEYLKSL